MNHATLVVDCVSVPKFVSLVNDHAVVNDELALAAAALRLAKLVFIVLRESDNLSVPAIVVIVAPNVGSIGLASLFHKYAAIPPTYTIVRANRMMMKVRISRFCDIDDPSGGVF